MHFCIKIVSWNIIIKIINCIPGEKNVLVIQYGDSWTRGSKTSAAVHYRKYNMATLEHVAAKHQLQSNIENLEVLSWSLDIEIQIGHFLIDAAWALGSGYPTFFLLVGSTILWLLICCMLFAYVRYSDRLNFDSGKWFWFILHISVNFLS